MNPGIVQLAVVVVVLAVVALGRRLFGSQQVTLRGTLYLKKLTVRKEEQGFIEAEAHRKGIIRFILSLLGVDSYAKLSVTNERVEFAMKTFSGLVLHRIPLRQLSNFEAGYTRPFALLVMGILLTIAAFGVYLQDDPAAGPFAFGLAVAAVVCIALFFSKRSFSLFFVSAGGLSVGMNLKASEVNGTVVTDLMNVCSQLVESRTAGRTPMVREVKAAVCPKCGESLELPSGIAKGQHVRCPFCGEKFSA